MEFSNIGKIEVDLTKIAFKEIGNEFRLLQIETDNYVILNDAGRFIWSNIVQGTRDIETLIKTCSTKAKILNQTASSQVIMFLDELKSLGFLNFKLSKEKDIADLLDASLVKRTKIATGAFPTPKPPPPPPPRPTPPPKPIPKPPPSPPKPPPKPPFGKSRSSCKTACV